MYRDPRAEALARLDAARASHTRSWAETKSLLEAIEVLRDQLKAKGMEAPKQPSVDPPTELDPSIDRAELADLLRAADAFERDGARLAASIGELRTFEGVLFDRVGGKSTELGLGLPPRAVPWTYAIAEAFPAWLLLGAPGAALAGFAIVSYVHVERAQRIAPVVGMAMLLLLLAYRAYRRMRFLRRCRVAADVKVVDIDVTNVENKNWPMRSASGWKVSRSSYTGSTIRTKLRWIGADGTSGTFVVRGTPYEGGVVLHDDGKAMCVVNLACAPRPDVHGAWERSLPFFVWVRVVVVVALVAFIAWKLLAAA